MSVTTTVWDTRRPAAVDFHVVPSGTDNGTISPIAGAQKWMKENFFQRSDMTGVIRDISLPRPDSYALLHMTFIFASRSVSGTRALLHRKHPGILNSQAAIRAQTNVCHTWRDEAG